MIFIQSIKAADDAGIGFEIVGSDSTAPVPDTGDLIHWTENAKVYTARVKSKTFNYDRSEVSMARADDLGVTITVIVDIVDVAHDVNAARTAIVS
jgi:hypothetical protein